jgi:pimeloyl-ACP methyl ester carboxylesterase
MTSTTRRLPGPDSPAWGHARSAPVDGFSLRYVRRGAGPAALLLHGWPGCWWDQARVLGLLAPSMDVVVPDLRGFGGSDAHDVPPQEAYGAEPQARSLLGLLDELGLERVVVCGFDVGSRVGQALARLAPERVTALVLSPPFASFGTRPTSREAQSEFWYQHFHRLALAEELIADDLAAVRAYLAHFWGHWSGAAGALTDEQLDELAAVYARPGAFRSSIAWYRAGAGSTSQPDVPAHPPLEQPVTILWGTQDPLFPTSWADRLHLDAATYDLRLLDGVGHFTPVEAPEATADAILAAAGDHA